MKYGVYKITNRENGKSYVGSSANRARQGVRGRLRDHKTNLNANRHVNQYLQNAWNKYGASAFSFEVLLYCDPEDCLVFEQIAIDCYQPKYNLCPIAGNTLGYRHTAKTLEHLKKMKNTPEFKSNMSARMKGNKCCVGRKLSKDTKAQISKSRRGQRNFSKLTRSDVSQILALLTQGLTQTKIASRFGVTQGTISMIKNGKRWSELS